MKTSTNVNPAAPSEEACVLLETRELTKFYAGRQGTVRALDGISLVVRPGEFVSVQGASGCGKTTLLLAAGGLLHPSTGQVLLQGQNLYDMPSETQARFRAETIGFVFQQFHLIPYLSVLDNVLAPTLALSSRARPVAASRQNAAARASTMAALSRGAATTRAMELVREFGLEARATHKPGALSTGERQRVALARALLNRPALLLADEPTGNLDEENGARVLDHLAAFARGGGAVLLATHDARAAARAHRFLRLEAGKLAGV